MTVLRICAPLTLCVLAVLYSSSFAIERFSAFEAEIGGKMIQYSSSDGSCKGPILIQGAPNSAVGVRAERVWLNHFYPAMTKKRQSLVLNGDRKMDRIGIVTREGVEESVCFDITEFFGKF